MSLEEKFSEDGLAQQQEIEDLRAALVRTQRDLKKAKAKTDHLVEATIEAARDAVLSHPLPKTPRVAKSRSKAGSEVALWHLTDWQGAKLTPSYNSQVMHKRVHRFVDKATKITDIQRKAHPVDEVVILFGGDMIEGLFNFPTQPFEIDATLFEQFVTVANLIVEVVHRALAVYPSVTVIGEWGNHGRLGSRRDAVPRSDNADRMTYELARQILKSSGAKVTWEDSGEDIQRVEVGAYRALLIHGDEIGRSGFASTNTITNHVNRWRSGSYPWDFRDVYVGHYHTHYQSSLADGAGAIYGTGSTESDNRYAAVGLASSAVPSQRLHFINPREGRVTAQYQVWLDD
jgi:uncharacterized coiled-coil protein SlyX